MHYINHTKPISILCIILILQSIGCVYSPKKTESIYKNCQLFTRQLTLTNSYKEFLKKHSQNNKKQTEAQARNYKKNNMFGYLEHLSKTDHVMFLLTLVAPTIIAGGTYIVSKSVILANNSLHWLEAKERCDDIEFIEFPTKNESQQ